ncbi:DUF3795 domain-containing protein [Eubacteriales bacterium OttesenSCG-928-A19]|nr:DUF3795 domain-containing protein [Eubacteriales bacterium OttesenSCG-928-A19]
MSVSRPVIAPCGIPCVLCMVYQREKKRCGGCYGPDESKPRHCVACKIKRCPSLPAHGLCSECQDYPCRRLKDFDHRYRTKYGMSLLENLSRHKEEGPEAFERHIQSQWACKTCGDLLCVHEDACKHCGIIHRSKQQPPVE